MAAPHLSGFDHVHVFVADREAAVAWYRRVLGFEVMQEYAVWATDGGPLTIADASGRVHIALFERAKVDDGPRNRATVALGTTAQGLAQWRSHLRAELGAEPALEDHLFSLSLYFRDPDQNPYEITTYEHAAARALLT